MGEVKCPPCNGTGYLASGICPECGGSGMIRDPDDDEENRTSGD